jgi:beta-N-acetylhexosaminidase
MRFWSRLFFAWVLVALIAALPVVAPGNAAPSFAQQDIARQKARTMLDKLTPEERVGQLFLVSFNGNNFDETTHIHDLITNHYIGGVILMRANDNFSMSVNTVTQAYLLNSLLQNTKWRASQQTVFGPAGAQYQPQYIPLSIGISQEGDDFPTDNIINGLTPLPSQMSIGATWNPAYAEQVGAAMGRELAALGFNLYFGPSLDVLDLPQIDSGEDMGVRTFGGDPYWVGKMGQAYISGLHYGSGGRLMVIAKHFPGRGGSDRAPEEEVPTVRKSLEQLKQIELAPFFSATGNATTANMVADGLLVSHIRYQGFQGNIRSTTRPVSSDAAALELILKLPAFAQWRESGGLMVSDNLGSQAVRRFYDPSGLAFDARSAAREAFLAGNDILILDRFVATNDPDPYTTIIRTLDFFAQKYREDDAFAQRVDASVERILMQKYELYPDFDPELVVPSNEGLSEVGRSQQITFDIARRSVTLISPSIAELPNVLPRSPELRDRMVFLTDVQYGRQCAVCPDQVALPVDALQSAVLRFYGPRAGGLVSQNLMSSYPFSDLSKYLNGNNDLETLENDLRQAEWVIVSMLKPNASQPDTLAFRRLLRERPDLLRNKKVVVFAFNAPYYLDATDISKLTAYFGMYSKTPPFVDVAARILFQELVATGSPPVSVHGVGYDLISVTSPDPSQNIPLFIDIPASAAQPTRSTQEPTPAPIFELGDLVPLRTGIIYDHNNNPVPDGTPFRFHFNVISQDSSTQQQLDTETMDGVARAVYRIERSGVLEIHVASEQGARSNLLRLDTLSGGVTVVPPTPLPTETPTPTPTATPTVTPTATEIVIPPPSVGVSDWVFVLLMISISAAGISWLGIRQAIARWGLRWALCGVIGGLMAYTYLALSLPGSEVVLTERGTTGVLVITFLGVIFGWGVGLFWRQIAGPGPRSMMERSITGPRSQSG